MAKKVTIEGSDKLHSLSDPWGGIGDGVNPVYNISIPDGTEWGMNRGEVERFIKKQFGNKVGYFYRDEENYLCGFASQDDYNTWAAAQGTEDESEVAELLLTRVKLPDVVNEDTYRVTLTIQELPAQMQSNNQVSIAIKGTSVVDYANGTTSNNDEQLDVFIDTSPSGASGSWVAHNVGRITANAVEYTTYSLESLLTTGVNYLRVRLVGEFASSLAKTFSVTVVNLSLRSATDFSVPFTDSLYFNFFINGSVNKSLRFEFCTGTEGDFTNNVLSWSLDIGDSVSMSTARSVSIPANIIEQGNLLSDGRHVFRVKLYHNASINTDWIVCEYLVGETGIVINDIQPRLTNWTSVTFFSWASIGLEGVVFQMYDENNTTFIDSWSYPATNETNLFSIQLSLDIDSDIENYGVVLRVLDSNGNTIHPSIPFVIENDSTFAPADNPDFVMIPANRDNTEVGKATIVNEANNSVLDVNETVFSGFGWLNDGWVGVLSDINDNTSDVIRALHIPAHHSVEIPYNPFSDFTGNSNTNRYATFEIDFRTNNILDYSEPIVQIGTMNNGIFWGLELLPTKGYMLTANKTSTFDQDVDWAEDERVHLAVNIVMSDGLRLVRLFINGTIEREFLYETNDKFTAASGVKIKIGNTSSDIDVFGIRSYKRSLETREVMQDFKASLEKATDKIAYNDKNDILVGGVINWAQCIRMGYNVIGHIGPLPHYVQGSDDNPTYGGKDDANDLVKLVINIANDPEHSCTLTNLEAKGQGTTAMTYFHWNQSYKITSNTKRYDNNGVEVVEMTGKGYSIANDGQNEEPKAKKLVGKINFASSMQSHKLGLTWIFTEVYKRLVAAGTIDRPYQMTKFPNSRISVFEKPFFFFHKESESDQEWTFKYLMTFGAGKGDKPTFGFDEEETGDMMMVEGADNEPALCNFARPWDNDGIYYNPSKEAWYEGREDDNYIVKSINFGFGIVNKVNGVEYPVDNTGGPLDSIRAFWNFAYLHHTGIKHYAGTLSALRADNSAEKDALYWVTTASEDADKYDLFRYNRATSSWVQANLNRGKLNLFTQYQSLGGTKTLAQLNGMTFQQATEEFASVRRSHFRANASDYFHVDDALYHSCFIKLFAATDNRAKNTYYYTDPYDKKIRWMQDDLDTVLRTNNMGQNRKPYYIEEHDIDESGAYYWKGEGNGFYNLLEEAFPTEMRAMMAAMLGMMSTIGGSVMNYLESRLLFVQRSAFPSIAYNEQARLMYESAQVAQANNQYSNATAPITQSMGSQLLSEYQWLLDRVMYISSWCEYGRFGAVAGGAPPDSWSFRSGGNGQYNFVIKSSKWVYPRVFQGGTKISPKVDVAHYRLKPYDANDAESILNYQSFGVTDGDVTIAVAGIDYLLDIGDLNFSVQKASLSFSGKRLRRLAVNEGGNTKAVFEPSAIDTVPKNITELIMRYVIVEGAGNLGTLNLNGCNRLEKIDLTGSEFTSVALPRTERLYKAVLPATLTTLVIEGCLNLGNTAFNAGASFSLASSANLKSITIKGSPYVPSLAIVNSAKNENAPLTEVVLHNINWDGVGVALMEWLTEIPTCELTGTITISNIVSFEQRRKMLVKWPNIGQSGENGLTINYTTIPLSDGTVIAGEKYIGEVGSYRYQVVPNPANANEINSISWHVGWVGTGVGDISDYASIDNDGVLTVVQIGSDDSYIIRVTCTIDSGLSTERFLRFDVGLYYREAEVGDYVFADGTWSDYQNPLKTVVGRCFYVNTDNPNFTDRRMVALSNLSGMTTADGAATQTTNWGPVNTSNSVQNYSYPYQEGVNNYNWYKLWPNEGRTNIASSKLTESNPFPWTFIAAEPLNISDANGILGVPNGTYVTRGKRHTLLAIDLRNKILNDVPLAEARAGCPCSWPPKATKRNGVDYTEFQEVGNLIQYMATVGTNYHHLLFPAFSYAYAYEPNANGLADKFKAHNWYIPSVDELEMLHYQTYIVSPSPFNTNAHLVRGQYRSYLSADEGFPTDSGVENNYFFLIYGSTGNGYPALVGSGRQEPWAGVANIHNNKYYSTYVIVACQF